MVGIIINGEVKNPPRTLQFTSTIIVVLENRKQRKGSSKMFLFGKKHRVDLCLEKEFYQPGERVEGTIKLEKRNRDKMTRLEVELWELEKGGKWTYIDHVRSFLLGDELEAGQSRVVEFQTVLPASCCHTKQYRLKTKLVTERNKMQIDNDPINILPTWP